MRVPISIAGGLSLALLSFLPVNGQTARLKPGPVGIVCLPMGNNPQHPLRDLADDPGWTNPEVKGFMIRDFWPMIEPAEGQYHFGLFDQALALAHRHNKFLGLAVCAGRASPDWLYAAGAQKFTFTRPGHAGGEERSFSMPVPWDPVFRAKWDALNQELGKRYDSDPNVAYIAMTGPGRDFETYYVSSPDDVSRFRQMDGFSQWAKAYRSIAASYAAAFPHTVLIYALGPPTPTPEGHEALDGAVNRLLADYPASIRCVQRRVGAVLQLQHAFRCGDPPGRPAADGGIPDAPALQGRPNDAWRAP